MRTDAEISEAKRAAETFDALTKGDGIYQKIFQHVSEQAAYRIECDDGAGVLNVCLGVDGDMHAAVWEGPRARELGHFGGPAYRARTYTGGRTMRARTQGASPARAGDQGGLSKSLNTKPSGA